MQSLRHLAESLSVALESYITQTDLRFSTLLEESSVCVYVKSLEGSLTITNRVYNEVFGRGNTAIGKSSNSLLDPSVLEVSSHSDSLVLGGCSQLIMEHAGIAHGNRHCTFQTLKRSLRHLNHDGFAILGLTKVVSIHDEAGTDSSLRKAKRRFDSLAELDRKIAIHVSRGSSPREVAETLDVCPKTVSNRRKQILRRFDLKNSMELACLLYSLQEHANYDFGLPNFGHRLDR